MYIIIKRIFDIIFSTLALFLLSVVMLVIALLIRINLGSPIFFVQPRVGKDNKIFKMIKFRSMRNTKDEEGRDLPDSERLTKFGKFLRSSSLDELPELINILKGDMSLIGPRPLLVEYLPLYNQEQIKRHNILPGLTGWAQINGRNALDWSKKFELDLWYINNISLKLDIKIFFLTIYKVLKRKDINKNKEATTNYFTGDN